jgi:outer membrane lipoprotein-sorting protein
MKRYAISGRRGARARSLAVALAGALAGALATALTAAPLEAEGALDAAAVLAKVDANESYASIKYAGKLEITIGGETRYKTMESVALGADKAFSEFTNPEDRGTRYLKLGKELWIYFPKEQDTVKISGHLLKEGMMGSDVSYEDALESRDYTAKYSAALKERDAVDGRDCYVVELSAKVPTAAYDRRLLWIDAERFVTLKQEMYAKSGKLLKIAHSLEVAKVGERWYPAKSEFQSKLRANTKTTFAMTKIEIDVAMDPKRFSMAALTK